MFVMLMFTTTTFRLLYKLLLLLLFIYSINGSFITDKQQQQRDDIVNNADIDGFNCNGWPSWSSTTTANWLKTQQHHLPKHLHFDVNIFKDNNIDGILLQAVASDLVTRVELEQLLSPLGLTSPLQRAWLHFRLVQLQKMCSSTDINTVTRAVVDDKTEHSPPELVQQQQQQQQQHRRLSSSNTKTTLVVGSQSSNDPSEIILGAENSPASAGFYRNGNNDVMLKFGSGTDEHVGMKFGWTGGKNRTGGDVEITSSPGGKTASGSVKITTWCGGSTGNSGHVILSSGTASQSSGRRAGRDFVAIIGYVWSPIIHAICLYMYSK